MTDASFLTPLPDEYPTGSLRCFRTGAVDTLPKQYAV